MFSLLNAICLALAGHGDSKRVNKFSNCWQMGTVTTSLGIFVTISLGKQPLTNENLYGRLPKVTEKKKSCAVACVAGGCFAVFFLLWFVE